MFTNENSLPPIVKIITAACIVLGCLILLVFFFAPKSEYSKNIDSATKAAKKVTPNAQVSDLKIADGFAIARVRDPGAESQADAGNSTIFKVNKDGSMTQIAEGSTFSAVDLLRLGISLATQAKLSGDSYSKTQQSLFDTCRYAGGDNPGYVGFEGSFDPDGWQIDTDTLEELGTTLTNTISNANSAQPTKNKTICVVATNKNSQSNVDTQTWVSVFSLDVEFITTEGIISTHKLTFSIKPDGTREYTLDGQKIS